MTMPFQTFDEQSDASQCAPRLSALRTELAARHIDGFMVPRADEHQGEYVPKRAERLAWLTGFTGSAGIAVVLMEKAAVFVDGRYTLQVKNQTDTKLFETLDVLNDGPAYWIEANLPKGAKLAYDPWLHTQAAIERFRQSVERAGGQLAPLDSNPLDAVWPDQPEPPRARAQPHPIELAGETSRSKRARLAEDLKKRGADAVALTLPDSICWLLNIRGADVPHTPFVLAFAVLNADSSVDLFMDAKKSSPELLQHLGNEVRLRAPADFGAALDALKQKTVAVDPVWAAAYIFQRLEKAGAKIVRAPDPCQLPKACKNEAELAGTRRAHIRDGQALSRFLAWFAREAPKGNLTEIDTVEKLESFRRATGALKDVSFDSISGAGPHGAIVHYRVTNKTNRKVQPRELFLIDSGAQFEDGTTDVTRTLAVGDPNPEMRDRFTRVLKGHIQLALARFPEGTTGAQLDAFARRPLWDAGLDYGHGTGHGVGSYLAVHEGPQSISSRGVGQALKPGMICSNEPGYYKTGEYGIRIENLVVVHELPGTPGAEKKMLGFETITMAPIDLDLVEPAMLTLAERDWLNAYHATVRTAVAPAFAHDAYGRAWLEQATRAI
jgi:Xaa-Pro aminopeptidase